MNKRDPMVYQTDVDTHEGEHASLDEIKVAAEKVAKERLVVNYGYGVAALAVSTRSFLMPKE